MPAEALRHADETTLEVLCEPGRDAVAKSYMWLYKTAKADNPIVIYDYQQGRSGDFAKRFLQDFKGHLMVDGYAGYRKLEPEVTLSCCWSHVRRKFDEALKVLPDKNPESTAAIGLSYCNKLFDIEREIADKSIEERKIVRQEQSKAVCEAFFSWAETESFKVLPKSAKRTFGQCPNPLGLELSSSVRWNGNSVLIKSKKISACFS